MAAAVRFESRLELLMADVSCSFDHDGSSLAWTTARQPSSLHCNEMLSLLQRLVSSADEGAFITTVSCWFMVIEFCRPHTRPVVRRRLLLV